MAKGNSKDISTEFAAMSGGTLDPADFEKILGRVGKGMGDASLNMEKYAEVISRQTVMEENELELRKKRVADIKKELNFVQRMLPWRNKEYKYLTGMNKEQTKSIRNLKLHNTAMGSVLSGLKKGAAGAASGVGKIIGKLGLLGAAITILKTMGDAFLRVNKLTTDVAKHVEQNFKTQ